MMLAMNSQCNPARDSFKGERMIYVYKCPRCEAVKELTRKVVDRDKPVKCTNCKLGVAWVLMVRQVTAPGGFKGLEVNR